MSLLKNNTSRVHQINVNWSRFWDVVECTLMREYCIVGVMYFSMKIKDLNKSNFEFLERLGLRTQFQLFVGIAIYKYCWVSTKAKIKTPWEIWARNSNEKRACLRAIINTTKAFKIKNLPIWALPTWCVSHTGWFTTWT